MYMWGSSSPSPSSSSPHTLPAKAPLRHQTAGRYDNEKDIRELDKGRDRGGHRGGKRKKIDCRKFERDLRDVSFPLFSIGCLVVLAYDSMSWVAGWWVAMFLWGLSELGGRREMKELKYANEPIHLPLVLNQFPKDGIRDQRAGTLPISHLPSPFSNIPRQRGESKTQDTQSRDEKIQTKKARF